MPDSLASGLTGPAATAAVILVVLAGAGYALWRRGRRRARVAQIPVVEWEQRARRAEARAAEAETVLKAGLLPYLARFLRAKLVVGLLHQRAELIQSHEAGTRRVAELDERVARAQSQLKERLAANPSAESVDMRDPRPPEQTRRAGAGRRSPFAKRAPRTDAGPLEVREIMARRNAAKPAPPPETAGPTPSGS